MIDIGDAVALTFSTYDRAGLRANADTVTCTITGPDGSTASPSVTNPQTGVYVAAYIAPAAGDYSVSWVASGDNPSAYRDSFIVADGESFISLDEAKSFLRMDNDDEDDELRTILTAAVSAVREWTGTQLRTVQLSESHDIKANQSAIILRAHALSVASVTETGTLLTTGQYKLQPNGEILTRHNGFCPVPFAVGIDAVTVDYTAGLDSTRRPIAEHAVKQMLAHLWETQRGNQQSIADGDWQSGMGYTFPNRVLELLEPLRTTGFA